MSSLSCHVLDTALGRPAAGMSVHLERLASAAGTESASWQGVGKGVTGADGRIASLAGPGGLDPGLHRLRFETEAYLRARGQPVFYPEVQVHFVVDAAQEHYHIPLLLSPFGYSTYRGS